MGILSDPQGKFTLETLGLFLNDSFISGGEFTIHPSSAKVFTLSEAVFSFNGTLYRLPEKAITIPAAGTAQYFLDFVASDGLVLNLAHPVDRPYLPIWTLNTDESGNIVSEVDHRGTVGTLQFRPLFEAAIQRIVQAMLDQHEGTDRVRLAESLPQPSLDTRGQIYQITSQSDSPDEVYQCMKLGNDTYEWVQIR